MTLHSLAERVEEAFVEEKCFVGGAMCGAWEEWFTACDDADPEALDEERDPRPLRGFPFDRSACERPDKCRLRAIAERGGG